MPDGGNLLIEAKPVAAGIEVAITDEGTGIPADILPKMFDPYFTTKELGTGLGLSMARDVMTRLDGEIRAENHSPQGASIILIFPIAE
jgi:signal transduction histidine kinase